MKVHFRDKHGNDYYFVNFTHLTCIISQKANKQLPLTCGVNLSRLHFMTFCFLPPANEVWGKVIFSQACVIPSAHGEGVCIGGQTPHPHRIWNAQKQNKLGLIAATNFRNNIALGIRAFLVSKAHKKVMSTWER